jgi:hypothetical protein
LKIVSVSASSTIFPAYIMAVFHICQRS